MSTSIDERVSGLPTNVEEGNSGEMQQKAPYYSQTAIPKDNSLDADQEKRLIGCINTAANNVWHYADQYRGVYDADWLHKMVVDAFKSMTHAFDHVTAKRPSTSDVFNNPEPRLKAEEARQPLFAGVSVIRAAIMDVIDVTEWRLYEGRDNGRYVREDVATAERGAFADAVEKRIRELQVPPFSLGTKLENYCPRHIRERLPAPTATVCADCMAEREEKK